MFGYEHQPFSFKPMSAEQFQLLTAPLRFYFDPVFEGIEKLDPNKPVLLVGNHTIYGVVDVPLLLAEIYRQRGIAVRALADHAHYQIPGWRNMLDRTGGVEGTRENCAKLMEQGEHILVFPGGAREVAKRKDEKYKLVWKKRYGFVHMAVKYGYPIVPFAVVGPDDMVDVVWDANDIVKSPLGKLLGKTGVFDKNGPLRGGDIIMPISRGLGFTGLPRPEKFYFAIGDVIETAPFVGHEDDKAVLEKVRNQTADAIEHLISEQLIKRAQDKKVGIVRRLLNRL